jgi:hypothetical protein
VLNFLKYFMTEDGTLETSLVFDATCFIERTDDDILETVRFIRGRMTDVDTK